MPTHTRRHFLPFISFPRHPKHLPIPVLILDTKSIHQLHQTQGQPINHVYFTYLQDIPVDTLLPTNTPAPSLNEVSHATVELSDFTSPAGMSLGTCNIS